MFCDGYGVLHLQYTFVTLTGPASKPLKTVVKL